MRCTAPATAWQHRHTRCSGYGRAAKSKRPGVLPPRSTGPLIDATWEVGRCAPAYTGIPARAQDTPPRRRILGGGGLMGSTLVKEALARFPAVGYDAHRVLITMAVQALDKPGEDGTPPRLYFGGADALLLVLRPELDVRDSKKVAAVRRDLARVMEDLVAVGAVSRVGGKARADNRQTWRLVLKPTGKDQPSKVRRRRRTAREALAKERSQDGSCTHPMDGSCTHAEDGSCTPSRMGAAPTPRNHEEPQEDLKEEPQTWGRRMRTGSGRPQEPTEPTDWPGHFADEDPDDIWRNREPLRVVPDP